MQILCICKVSMAVMSLPPKECAKRYGSSLAASHRKHDQHQAVHFPCPYTSDLSLCTNDILSSLKNKETCCMREPAEMRPADMIAYLPQHWPSSLSANCACRRILWYRGKADQAHIPICQVKMAQKSLLRLCMEICTTSSQAYKPA